jgi:hypothetical protein
MNTRVTLCCGAIVAIVLAIACVAEDGQTVEAARPSAPERAKTFARLPDWTGYWETELSAALVFGEFDPQAGGAAPPGVDPVALAFMTRSKLAGRPPYNSEWERRTQLEVKALKRAQLRHAVEPPSFKVCREGFPAAMESPVPDGMFQVLVTPEEAAFIFPSGEVRHVFTDGRGHPRKEDLWPSALGDSIGHWEKDTLVIHTIARKAGPIGPIAMPGATQLSEQTEFTERLRRVDIDTMQNDMTIFDPQRFARPWKLSIRYVRVKDMDRMIPVECSENDRNQVVKGRMTIVPP